MVRSTLILILLIVSAHGAELTTGPITAEVVRVIDGDTIVVVAHPWPSLAINTSVRIDGIDTPELRGDCDEERAMAQMAKQMVIEDIGEAPVLLRNIKLGKFAGRVVADVETMNGDLRSMLLGSELARPYDGGKRQGWCG